MASVYAGSLESAVSLCEWQLRKAKFIARHRCCADVRSALPRPWEADLHGAHCLGPLAYYWLPAGKPRPDTGGWRRDRGTGSFQVPRPLPAVAGRWQCCPPPPPAPHLLLAALPPWWSHRSLPHSPLGLAGRRHSPASTSPVGPLSPAHPSLCYKRLLSKPSKACRFLPRPSPMQTPARLPPNRDGQAQRTGLSHGGS